MQGAGAEKVILGVNQVVLGLQLMLGGMEGLIAQGVFHRPGKMTLRSVNAMVQKRHWSSVSAYPLCAYCTQLEPRRVSSECPPLVMPLSQSCKEKLQLQPSSAALLLPSEGGCQPEKKPLHL